MFNCNMIISCMLTRDRFETRWASKFHRPERKESHYQWLQWKKKVEGSEFQLKLKIIYIVKTFIFLQTNGLSKKLAGNIVTYFVARLNAQNTLSHSESSELSCLFATLPVPSEVLHLFSLKSANLTPFCIICK